MIPGLCGIILVFVGTVATALGVVRERQAAPWSSSRSCRSARATCSSARSRRTWSSPPPTWSIVVVAGMLLFDVPFRGSVAVFALGALLFLFVTLGTGVLISTVSQTQGQAIQLAMMTLLPQFLLSGLFFPLYSMPWAVRWIGYLLPLTYFIKVARGVMVRGAPIGALWLPLVVLAVMAARRVHGLHPALPPRPGAGRRARARRGRRGEPGARPRAPRPGRRVSAARDRRLGRARPDACATAGTPRWTT